MSRGNAYGATQFYIFDPCVLQRAAQGGQLGQVTRREAKKHRRNSGDLADENGTGLLKHRKVSGRHRVPIHDSGFQNGIGRYAGNLCLDPGSPAGIRRHYVREWIGRTVWQRSRGRARATESTDRKTAEKQNPE